MKIFLFIMIFSGLSFGTYSLATFFIKTPSFQITKLVVSSPFEDKELESWFHKEYMDNHWKTFINELKEQYIWNVDLKKVSDTLSQGPHVKSVSVTRAFPNELKLHVDLKKPKLFLYHNKETFLVDEEGELFSSQYPISSYPILRGEAFFHDKKKRVLALKVFESLPDSGFLTHDQVSEFLYDQDKGVVLVLKNAHRIFLGHDQWERHIGHVELVLNYLDQEKITWSVIDARFQRKVVVRLRNKT